MKKQPPTNEPIKLKVGPVEIEGPLRIAVSLLLGLLVGAGLVLYVVAQYQQPSILIDPIISRAVSATMTAQPTATPTATPVSLPILTVLDMTPGDNFGNTVLPEQGEYKILPGQKVEIQVMPAREGKMYRWRFEPSDNFGPGTPPTGPHASFTAPEKEGARTTVFVCELDQNFSCPGGGVSVIIINATTKR